MTLSLEPEQSGSLFVLLTFTRPSAAVQDRVQPFKTQSIECKIASAQLRQTPAALNRPEPLLLSGACRFQESKAKNSDALVRIRPSGKFGSSFA